MWAALLLLWIAVLILYIVTVSSRENLHKEERMKGALDDLKAQVDRMFPEDRTRGDDSS